MPPEILSRDPLFLNIGGIQRREGWVTVNSQAANFGHPHGEIDLVRKMHDLYGFRNASVGAIYASHTLEHSSMGDGELEDTLREWRRYD